MTIRKSLVTALITMSLALATLASSASAQCSTGGGTGSTQVQIAVVTDGGGSLPIATSWDFDFLTRLRWNTYSLFSWGRGPVGQPGTVRSSFAVLRERLGLKR